MKKPALKDISNAAGTAVSTVSAILLNKGPQLGISAVTIEKVQRIADELGYIPQNSGRSLRKGVNQAVLAVLPDTPAAFHWYSGYLFGALQEAGLRKYKLYAETQLRGSMDLDSNILGSVDGAVFFHHETAEEIRELEKSGIPCVSLSSSGNDNTVRFDVSDAAQTYLAYLHDFGITELHVWTPLKPAASAEVGFLDAVLDHFPGNNIITDISQNGVENAITHLIASDNRSAVFSIKDQWLLDLAFTALHQGLWERGEPFPWKVLSYESSPRTGDLLADLGILRFSVEPERIGKAAVGMLIERIKNKGKHIECVSIVSRVLSE